MMSFDDSLMVLICVLLAVERSKETLTGLQAVVVHLMFCWGDKYVSKESVEFYAYVAGTTAALSQQGRTIPARSVRFSREFDPTKGFAGQDILSYLFNLFTQQPTSQDVSPSQFSPAVPTRGSHLWFLLVVLSCSIHSWFLSAVLARGCHLRFVLVVLICGLFSWLSPLVSTSTRGSRLRLLLAVVVSHYCRRC